MYMETNSALNHVPPKKSQLNLLENVISEEK